MTFFGVLPFGVPVFSLFLPDLTGDLYLGFDLDKAFPKKNKNIGWIQNSNSLKYSQESFRVTYTLFCLPGTVYSLPASEFFSSGW